MKVLLFVLTILLTGTVSISQTNITDLDRIELKGNVKSLIEITLTAKRPTKNLNKLDTTSIMTHYFNTAGFFTEEFWYFKSRGDSSRTVYSYNESGIRTGFLYHDLSSGFKHINRHQLDEEGRAVESIAFTESGDSINKVTFRYNEQGWSTERKVHAGFVAGGDLLYTTQWTYDESNRLIHKIYFTADSTIYRTYDYFYENEYVNRMIYTSTKGKKQTYTYTYTFDEHGNWDSKTTYIGKRIKFIEYRLIEYY